MRTTTLLHELITASAERDPASAALTAGTATLSYQDLDAQVAGFAAGLIELVEDDTRAGAIMRVTVRGGRDYAR